MVSIREQLAEASGPHSCIPFLDSLGELVERAAMGVLRLCRI